MPIRVQTCGDVCQDGTYVGASFDVRNRPQHARTDTAASCYAQPLDTTSVTDGIFSAYVDASLSRYAIFFGGYAATLTAVNEPVHDESGVLHFMFVGTVHPTDRLNANNYGRAFVEREKEREREGDSTHGRTSKRDGLRVSTIPKELRRQRRSNRCLEKERTMQREVTGGVTHDLGAESTVTGECQSKKVRACCQSS